MEENYLTMSRKVFSTLSPREEKIIRLREIEGHTLERIGTKLNLTRQRIHQIEKKINRKLKHTPQDLNLLNRFTNLQTKIFGTGY